MVGPCNTTPCVAYPVLICLVTSVKMTHLYFEVQNNYTFNGH